MSILFSTFFSQITFFCDKVNSIKAINLIYRITDRNSIHVTNGRKTIVRVHVHSYKETSVLRDFIGKVHVPNTRLQLIKFTIIYHTIKKENFVANAALNGLRCEVAQSDYGKRRDVMTFLVIVRCSLTGQSAFHTPLGFVEGKTQLFC